VNQPPAISITMPTYKRADLLPRAVDSVLAQTFDDWELIITDDEDPPGEAWAYLEALAQREPRVRILRNPGEHGQVGNNNFALQQARGTWVKPLYDDDALKPACLARMMEAVDARLDAALVCCLADNYNHDELSKPGVKGAAATLEALDAGRALLACYLQDYEVGTPVQVMFRRTCVDAGILWEKPEGMHSAFDTWWLYRIMATGPMLLLNEPLIDQHWGHETGTSIMQRNPELLDEDLAMLKRMLRPMIPDDLNAPPLPVVLRMLKTIRALLRLRDRRPVDAMRLLAASAGPRPWALARRWWINKRRPGMSPIVPRESVWP